MSRTLAVCSPNFVQHEYNDSRSGFEKAYNNLINRFIGDGGLSIPPSSAKNYRVVRLIKIGTRKDHRQDSGRHEEIYNLSHMTYKDKTGELRWNSEQNFYISSIMNKIYGDV